MATATTSSFGVSTPSAIQTPQSDWSLQLSQLLGALTQNQYNWAMNQYNQGQQITDANINNYMQLEGQGAGLAQNLLGRYENTFEPIMNQYIQQAGSYNSQARQNFMMGQAESTAAQADQAAMNSAQEQLQSYGINPNSGRYQDLITATRMQDAATRAGAGTQASVNTAAIGRQMTQQAAQFGQNVPGMTVNALNSAYTGVTGAENAQLGLMNTGANLMNTVPNFANAAANANKLPPVGNTTVQGSSSQTPQKENPPPKPPQAPQGGGSSGPSFNQNMPTGGNPNPIDIQPNGQNFDAGAPPDVGNPSDYPSAPYQSDPFNNNDNGNYGGYNSLAGFADNSNNAMPGGGTPTAFDPFNGTGASQQQGGGLPSVMGDTNGPGGVQSDPFNMSANMPTKPGNPSDSGYPVQPPTPGALGGQQFAGNIPQIPASQSEYPGAVGGPAQPPSNAYGQWGVSTPAYGGDMPSGPGQAYPGDQSQPYQDQNQMDQNGGYSSGQSWDQSQYQDPNQMDQNGGYSSGQSWDQSQPQQMDQNGGYSSGQSWDQSQPQQMDANGGYSSGGGYSGGSANSGDYVSDYAKGGPVRARRGVLPTTGGNVPRSASPSRGRVTDDVPARLNAGEFVIPRDVTAHMGTKHFQDLIKKSRQMRTGMSGPAAKPKAKPALRMRPTFTSSPMSPRVAPGMGAR